MRRVGSKSIQYGAYTLLFCLVPCVWTGLFFPKEKVGVPVIVVVSIAPIHALLFCSCLIHTTILYLLLLLLRKQDATSSWPMLPFPQVNFLDGDVRLLSISSVRVWWKTWLEGSMTLVLTASTGQWHHTPRARPRVKHNTRTITVCIY